MASWLFSAVLLAAVGGNSDCTIVHFTAGWCQPCQQVRPSLEQLAQEGWSVRSVDVDREPQIVQQFNVQNLPTVVILCRDQEVDRMVGAAPYEQIRQRVERAAARNQSGATRGLNSRATPAPTQVAATPQPIVRGQSPASGAFPMLNAVASQAARTHNVSAAHTAALDVASSAAVTPASYTPAAAAPASLAAAPISLDAAIARAAAATVRIRVDEANTTAYGTGTIIDVHGQEALVLTCGHLFRDMQPNSQLTIDLFPGTAQEVNLPSQLIDFTAEETDIGLISFRLPMQIEPVPILPRGDELQVGQPAFSFGCDHGADPTRRDTNVRSINRYVGAANVEIAGAPAVGRSGGGLFDQQGRLIGVCNAADATDDEGIYAAAEVVYAQIERLGMSHLFDTPAKPSAAPAQVASMTSPLRGQTPAANDLAAADVAGWDATAPAWPDQALDAGKPAAAATAANASPSQVICIVRDAVGQDRVVTIDAPTPQLMQLIQQSSSH